MRNYRLVMAMAFILLLSIPCVVAQKQLRNVFVGDAVPDITVEGVKDAEFTSMHLVDFTKDKLLILDFWATWCAPCVYYLPKMDSIQREFGKRIQIVTVTKQPEHVVRDFFKIQARKQMHVSPLPKVFEDKVLSNLFPHLAVPHYVWIKDGVVIAVTENVTRQGVEEALRGENVNLLTKVDLERLEYNRYNIPLVDFLKDPRLQNNEQRPFNYSFFTRFIPELGYNGGYIKVKDTLGNMRLTATNVNLLTLFKLAFGESKTFLYDAGVDIRTDDSLFRSFGLSGMAARPLIAKKAFCYEIVSKDTQLFKKMQQDLKYAFPEISAKLIEVIDTCIVLEKINDNIKKFFSNNQLEKSIYNNSGGCISNKNVTMQSFRTTLEGSILVGTQYPIVDETGVKELFSFEVCDYTNSIERVNKLLIPYGLQLVKRLAKHNRLVIDKCK